MGRRDIEARLRQLEAERAQLTRYGDDVYDDGDVIKFVKTFRKRKLPTDGYTTSQHYEMRDFTYVALKVDGKWFPTGMHSDLNGCDLNGCDWDTLVEFMYQGTSVSDITISIAENFLTRTELEAKLAAQDEAADIELDIRDEDPANMHVAPEAWVQQNYTSVRDSGGWCAPAAADVTLVDVDKNNEH